MTTKAPVRDADIEKNRKDAVELARIYSGLVSQKTGREYRAIGKGFPEESFNWVHFTRLASVLKLKDLWHEREVFLAAQFHRRPGGYPIPYPNTLYGATAWFKFEVYRKKRGYLYREAKAYTRPDAVDDRTIVGDFEQSVVFYKGYRRFGISALRAFETYKDVLSPFFIAISPTAGAYLSSGSYRFGAEVLHCYRLLDRRPSLRTKLEKLWRRHVG